MCRRLLCLAIGCLLLTATTTFAADRSEIGATPLPLPYPVPLLDGVNQLGPQPEPPDIRVEDRLDPFEWFLQWLFGL
jgi:hypothetical protein